jgi:fibronectin type 3 domain-containing protein
MIGRGRRLAACLGLAALALTACGKKTPPVAPEHRAPQPVADLAGTVHEESIVLSWTPPSRRDDNTRIRDFALMRIFRVEDSGTGQPKSAMLTDGRIAGYDEVAAIRGAEPEPAVRRGPHLEFTDRKNLSYGRRYTYVILAGDAQGRIGRPSGRVSVSYAAAPAEPGNLVAEPREGEVRLTWNAPTRLLDGSAITDALTYEVLRAPSEDAELAPVAAAASGTTLTDSKLENERAYYYAVRAIREVAGTTIYGRPTSRLAATPRDVTPPSAPGNLVAIASEGVVRLSWSPSPEPDVAGYIVYRAPVGGGFERIGAINAPGTTYADRTAPRGTSRYVVTAQDNAARPNESARSNEVRVTQP